MARAGDELGYYYVEGYIDEDYIRYEPYIESGYITEDYFQEQANIVELEAQTMAVAFAQTVAVGKLQSVTVNLAGAMNASIFAVASRNGSIDMATAVTMSTDAERTRSSDVVLQTIINLSLQGDRLRGASSAISSSFTTTQTALRIKPLETALAVSASISTTILRIKPLASDLGAAFTPTISAVASLNGSINLHVSSSILATSGNVKKGTATLATSTAFATNSGLLLEDSAAFASNTTMVTRAIEFIAKSYNNDRPIESGAFDGTWTIDTATKKHGSGSIKNINDGSGGLDQFRLLDIDSFNGGDTVNSYTFEFWYNTQQLETTTVDRRIMWISSSSGTIEYYIDQSYQVGGAWFADIRIIYPVGSGNAAGQTFTGISFEPSTWHYFAIQFKPRASGVPNLSFTVDSTVINTFTGSPSVPLTDMNYILYAYGRTAGYQTNFDSISVRQRDNSGAFIAKQAYSSEPTNDEDDTLALFLFNGNTLDSTSTTLTGAASLTSSFTQTVDITGAINASATTLSSASTITADVDKVVSADSALSATFSQTVSYGRIRRTVTSLNSAFAQNAINTRTRDYDSALSATATQTATIGSIKEFEVDYTAFNTQVAVVAKIGDFLVDYATQSTLSASAQTTKQGVAALDSSLGVVASAESTVTTSSALSTTTAISATGDRTRDVSASFEAFNSQATVVARRRAGIADINSEFAISVTGVVFAENETLLDSVTTLEITPPLRTRTGASTLSTNTVMSVQGIKAVEAGATLLSAGGFALSANTTASGAFDLNTTATMSADCSRRAGGDADISTSVALSVAPSQIKGSTVDLTSSASVSTNAGALLQGEVAIDSAMSFRIQSKVLHLQQYVYTIPKDTRIYTVERESRAHTVQQETRTYTIEGE